VLAGVFVCVGVVVFVCLGVRAWGHGFLCACVYVCARE